MVVDCIVNLALRSREVQALDRDLYDSRYERVFRSCLGVVTHGLLRKRDNQIAIAIPHVLLSSQQTLLQNELHHIEGFRVLAEERLSDERSEEWVLSPWLQPKVV